MNDHQHYTTSSLKERFLFHKFSIENPHLFTSITYSDPESQTEWDVIYTTTASTKPYILDVKTRNYHGNYAGYYIERDKYDKLVKSADTYNIQYVNFTKDQQVLIWDLQPGEAPVWIDKRMQHNNISNQGKDKSGADLPTSAATKYNITYSLSNAAIDAEREYKARLSPKHKKKWKNITLNKEDS